MVQLPTPIFVTGDVVRITDDRKKAMVAQKSIGTEWTEDILDVSAYIIVIGSLQLTKDYAGICICCASFGDTEYTGKSIYVCNKYVSQL